MPLRRSPATAADDLARYPSLDAFDASRRRFLKICAMSSAAAALGLPLVGCPSSGGGGGGGNPDWIPWEDHEPLAGAAPMPMGKPVAVVVAGGPVAVTFKDGKQAQIVVAGVVTPMQGTNVKADCTQRAAAHTKIVQDVFKQHPSSVLADVAALDKVEDELMMKLNGSLGSGYIDQVSAAEAKPPEAPKPPQREAGANESASAPAPSAPAAAEAPAAAAPAPPAEGLTASPEPAKAAKPRAPKADRIWAPCRTPGCTSCS